MARGSVTVRILGVASTTRGFAFAVTEGPRRLVAWELRGVPAGSKAVKAIDSVIRRARPLFVAFDREAALRKRHRGKRFSEALTEACDELGVMMLFVTSEQTRALSDVSDPNKWDIADAVVKLFPHTAHRLPARRKAWQSEDDRIGLFMALAAAVATWDSFRKPER